MHTLMVYGCIFPRKEILCGEVSRMGEKLLCIGVRRRWEAT